MIAAWFRERFTLHLFVPLAVIIGLAASGGSSAAFADCGFALLLLAQFRLWDDLADRATDTLTHPRRVLARAPDVAPAIAFCGALAVLNICVAVWRDGSGVAVSLLALVDGLLGAWYLSPRSASALLPLLKYPAMLAIVAGGRIATAPVHIAVTAAVLYAAVCAYEAWHDPSGPVARRLSTGGH